MQAIAAEAGAEHGADNTAAQPNARPRSTPRLSPQPRTNSPRRSGRLKVVRPSPTPNVVPMAANRTGYCVRETAEPSAFSQPVGADCMAKCITAPDGTDDSTAAVSSAGDTVIFAHSVQRPPLRLPRRHISSVSNGM